MAKYDFYIAASLHGEGANERNTKIENILIKKAQKVFRPTFISDGDPRTILERNLRAINEATNFLVVVDDPGEGVFIEVGYAFAQEKQIYVLNIQNKDCGRMFDGIISQIPRKQHFQSLEELIKTNL